MVTCSLFIYILFIRWAPSSRLEDTLVLRTPLKHNNMLILKSSRITQNQSQHYSTQHTAHSTPGLDQGLTLEGSGRKVDITGGLPSLSSSLLTAPTREWKRISGLDFLRICGAGRGQRASSQNNMQILNKGLVWTGLFISCNGPGL